MNIITYCPEPLLQQCRRLLRFLDVQYPDLPREHYSSLPDLGLRLQRPRLQEQTLVFMAPNQQCLEQIASLRREVQGNVLVLIVPDGQEATQTLGHSLRPRLLTSLDEDMDVIEQVLTRLIERAQEPGAEMDSPGGRAPAKKGA